MSFFRPPESSSATVWAGRAAAIGGIALGLSNFAGFPAGGMTSVFQVVETLWPLAIGVGSSLAIWRNAEKAAEVNHDTRQYHRALNGAMNRGQSETHLPSRMLDPKAQVGTLATGLGTLASVIGIGAGLAMLWSVGSAALLGGAAPSLLVKGAIAAATFAAGVAGWRVTSVAAEARDFASSREASAERARIATGYRPSVQRTQAPAPTPVAATPLSDMIARSQQAELAMGGRGPGLHAARILGERQDGRPAGRV